MAGWRDFPLPDGSYSDDCRPFTQQDVCNYLPTFAEATGTRSRAKYVPVPGLVTLSAVGNGPHRGIRDVEGKLFVVSGNTLYQVATDGTATSRGTIPGTRRVSMVHNQIDGGNELIIATGDNSYVWNTVTETLTATGIPLVCVDFVNQLIVGVDVARRFWRWSGLADAAAWNSLDNGSAESSPDRLVWLIVSQGEVLLFGERTIEVWQNSVAGNATFQRSTVIEKGCANGATVCRLDNTVYFVGNDMIPYRLQGYTPTPIASKAITAQIAQGDPGKLFANTWEDRGYVVYYLTAQDGQTWGFDVTCQKWHRRESFGLTRWRVNTLCKWNGDWYAGDYSNGRIYRLEWGSVFEGCEIMPRTLRTGVMHNNGNRMFVSALKLLVNTGREPSVASDAPTISGSLPDGDVGDVVDYQYTITPAYPGQAVTLTLTGALPAGLTMDASGHVTGTITAEDSASWTITPSSDCGDGVALDDSATFAGYWLLTGEYDFGGGLENACWTAPDLSGTWDGPYARLGTTATKTTSGAYSTGTSIIFFKRDSTYYEVCTDLDPANHFPVTAATFPYTVKIIRCFGGGVAVAITADSDSGPSGAGYYGVTLNGGQSWSWYMAPTSAGSTPCLWDIARLDSGRWVAIVGSVDAGRDRAVYSDSDFTSTPSWMLAETQPANVERSAIACCGSGAVISTPNGGFSGYTSMTSDGNTWAVVRTGAPQRSMAGALQGYRPGFVFECDGSGYGVLSAPAVGTPWNLLSSIGVARFTTDGTTVVGMLDQSNWEPYKSADQGATFSAVTLPAGISNSKAIEWVRAS